MTDAAKTLTDSQRDKLEAEAKAENAKRTGKGTRVRVGSTRGKNPQPISFEAFDETQPETLPKTLSEFMEVTKVSDENTIVGYLVDGFNSASYTAASDPIAEYVEPTWPDDIQRTFRLIVRNYANNANIPIEDAVALIKPGIVAAQEKAKAAQTQPTA
jgi:hypothetical protein